MTTTDYVLALRNNLQDYISTNSFSNSPENDNLDNHLSICNYAIWQKMLNYSEPKNFQVTIPSETSLFDFYESTLWAIAMAKYGQNCQNYKSERNLQIDSRLYCPRKDKIYIYRGTEHGEARLMDKDSMSKRNFSDLDKMFLLAPQFIVNNNTKTYFKSYNDTFSNRFTHYKALTYFDKKTLIIASKELMEAHSQKNILPIRYNFNVDSKVPVEPLIELVNDWNNDKIEGLLWSDNHCIDEVIFIGKNKYSESFQQAIEHQKCGRIKRVILLGEQSIAKDFEFNSWYWTAHEVHYLKNNIKKDLLLSPISNEELVELKGRFDDFTKDLVALGVNTEDMKAVINRYINYFLIPPLIDSENTPLRKFKEELENGNSDFEIILENAGINTISYKLKLFSQLEALDKLMTHVHPKLETIKRLWNDTSIKATYIIVKSKRYARSLEKFVENKKGLKVLTHQELRGILKSPKEKGMFNEKGNLRRNHFIFTYLHLDYEPKKRNPLSIYALYEETLQYGQATILYYKEIEQDRLDKIRFFAEQQKMKHLTHPNRQFFTGDLFYEIPITTSTKIIEFVLVSETNEILSALEIGFDENSENDQEKYFTKINNYFAKYFGEYKRVGRNISETEESEDDDEIEHRGALHTSKAIYKNITKFEITFDDDSSDSLYATQKIACKAENGDQIIGIKVEDLKKTDKVVDFDIRFDNASDVLETIPEAREDIDKIQKASKLWREWLNYSLENYKQIHKLSDDEACKKLTKKLEVSVSEMTVKSWLKNKEKYFFPRTNDDLEKVLDLRIRQTKESDREIRTQQAKKIREARNTSASFKEVITQLKVELGNYLINKQKGDILSRIKVENDIKKLLHKQQFKSIIKIEKL